MTSPRDGMVSHDVSGVESPTGWRRYFSFSTDHKVIGIQYILTTFVFFLIAGLLAMLMRAELLTPQLNVVDRAVYNGLFTLHGTMMIFLWIIQTTNSEAQHPDLQPLPPTAQVAYQQGYAIARNLRLMALGYDLKPAKVDMRGILLKLGLNESVANLFNQVEIDGEAGYLIRQGAYLELLPTPLHDFKATAEWLKDEIFERHHSDGVKQAVKAAEIAGGVVVGAIVAKNLVNALSKNSSHST